MNYNDIIYILLIVGIVLVEIIIAVDAIIRNRKQLKELKALEEKIRLDNLRYLLYQYKIHREHGPKDDDFNMLDHLIEDAVNRYKIMHFGFNKDLYLDSKLQEKMVSDILVEVLNMLSPVTFDTLCVIYDKEHLEDLILSKIKIAILDYTISVNGTYKE